MVVGVVEEVGKDGKKAFHTLYELWDILNTKKEKQTKQRKTEDNGMGRAYSYPPFTKGRNSPSLKKRG
jgi:hypothetical protein